MSRLSFISAAAPCLAPAPLLSQEFRGTISGSVTDPLGATMPNVKIFATEIRTGTKNDTVSDSAGQSRNIQIGARRVW